MVTRPDAAFRLISDHEFAVVRQNLDNDQKGFFAQRSYSVGDTISVFSASAVLSEPNYLTVQVGIGRHILLQPEHLQYINHSCEPNVFFDTSSMEIVALQHIAVGDELTFFYPSTEWDMAQPFHCNCGCLSCLGTISGAAHLSREVISKYRFTSFIQQQFNDRTDGKERA